MKPEGARYRAITQVKGLSPEIPLISEVGISVRSAMDMMKADAVHEDAGSMLITVKRGYKHPTGSETVARYYRDKLGTRESHNAPDRVWVAKSEKDKAIQMALWQSRLSRDEVS